MSKHTPGPWRIFTPGPNGCYTVGTHQGLMTATVAHSANHLAECEQAIADARLIAAAPKLLAALKHLMVAHGEQLDYAFQQAQEAIAEAEGLADE